RRWIKRHRLLATGVVVAVLMTLVLSGGGWLWWTAGGGGAGRPGGGGGGGGGGGVRGGGGGGGRAGGRRGGGGGGGGGGGRWGGLLESGGGSEALGQRVRQVQQDLEMVEALEEVRLQRTEREEGVFDAAWADQEYAAAFQRLDMDVDRLTLAEATARIEQR